MLIYVYYAIQLPSDPKFDWNCGFMNKEDLLRGMELNYGKKFHYVYPENDEDPIYICSESNEVYARLVIIAVKIN